MSTPIINAINNVNDSSITTLFKTVANNSVARDNLSQSDRNVDAVGNDDTAADAVVVNGDAVRLCLVRREGYDPSNYSQLSDVASDSFLMENIASRSGSANIMARSGAMMDSVIASTVAMDAVSASQTAMDAVSASQTAMDAVSASQIARDAVNASELAYDTIAAVKMATGKFVAGSAGLTPGDYADIDAVTSSQTAMDAVSASTAAYSAAFKSDYSISSLWASSQGAKTILESSGSNTLPYTDGSGTFSVDDGTASSLPGTAAHQLFLDVTSIDQNERMELTYTIDLSNVSTLEITDKNPTTDPSSTKGNFYGMTINGSNLYATELVNSSFTTRTFDISSYSGECTVGFFIKDTDDWNRDMSAVWSELNLV